MRNVVPQTTSRGSTFRRVPASEARATLAELLEAVGEHSERILIERRGKRAVAIVSVDDLQQLELLEARQASESAGRSPARRSRSAPSRGTR